MKIQFARRGYSNSGDTERYLIRLVRGLQKKGISTSLVTDGAWPEDQWPGDERIVLESHSPASFAEAVTRSRADHPDALLFSFERIPCADIFWAGNGIHTAYLQRQTAEETRLATWFRKTRRHHRETCHLEEELFTTNKRLQVICNSAMVANDLRNLFNFTADRTTLIYSGFTPTPWDLDEQTEARLSIRKKHNIPDGAPIILFVGSNWKREGAKVLAEAFRRLNRKDTHLILVGKGRLKNPIPPRVHLTGPIAIFRDYFLAADLFALPTLYDPFSNACLEAATYGLPVLTTDGNGFAEALDRFPGSGEIISKPRDPSAWTDALSDWLDQESTPSALESLVDVHTLDHNIDETVALLSSLVSENHPFAL